MLSVPSDLVSVSVDRLLSAGIFFLFRRCALSSQIFFARFIGRQLIFLLIPFFHCSLQHNARFFRQRSWQRPRVSVGFLNISKKCQVQHSAVGCNAVIRVKTNVTARVSWFIVAFLLVSKGVYQNVRLFLCGRRPVSVMQSISLPFGDKMAANGGSVSAFARQPSRYRSM